MNALDINKLKQELKLIVDTNLRDYDKVASLLNVGNIKDIKNNIYYLREVYIFI